MVARSLVVVVCLVVCRLGDVSGRERSAPLIVDHTCLAVKKIPEWAVASARSTLHIGYGHTSHGSQLSNGMRDLVFFANSGGQGLSLPANAFRVEETGNFNGEALHLRNGRSGVLQDDCGYYPQWVEETRKFLDDTANSRYNVIMWSWCGQVSRITESRLVSEYLDPMNQLEREYPEITFVYMTGHADGTGESGNLHMRNRQIRSYCMANNKVLYDFYDIECHDPDGVYYGDRNVNDNCDYDSDSNGTLDRNWATDWQAGHTEGVDWFQCSAAHSQPLNGNLKAYAAWWLWTCLAGWDPRFWLDVNGGRNLAVSPGDPLTFRFTIDPDEFLGIPADWWACAKTPEGFCHYEPESGLWKNGLSVSYQNGLHPLDNYTVHAFAPRVPGLTVIYFAVDDRMDGTVNGNMRVDSVSVTVR